MNILLIGSGGREHALCRALALDPELLFLDEPTAGLDPIGAAAFDTLIKDLSDSLNLTVFMITHDLVKEPDPDQKVPFVIDAVLWGCTLALFLGCGMCAAEDRICEAAEKVEKP